MPPRPLHTENESKSRQSYSNDELTTAKNRFSDSISNGMSVLVGRHGYSRERAVSLILDQIRHTDESPSEDDVFRAMHHLHLGLEGARQSIIVGGALQRVQKQRGLKKADAIDYLSSCLTTMKLLGSVEKNASVPTTDCSPSSTLSEEFMSSTLVNSSPAPALTPKLIPSMRERKTVNSNTNTNNTRRIPTKNISKTVKSRQTKPPKPSRKRPKEDDSLPSNKVDAQVVGKALLVNCKTSSPSGRQAGKRVGSHREELDNQGQPVPKRQRLDSI